MKNEKIFFFIIRVVRVTISVCNKKKFLNIDSNKSYFICQFLLLPPVYVYLGSYTCD